MRTIAYTAALLMLVAFSTAQTHSTPKLALDGTKPIVYISFDHIAARPPVEDNEPDQGLWLHLVNRFEEPQRSLPTAVVRGWTSTLILEPVGR